MKITELNTDMPMPQITFLDRSEPGALGAFFPQDKNVEIYLGSIRNSTWQFRESYDKSNGRRGCDVSYEDGKVRIYDTTAHEMIHYALYLKGVPLDRHHRQMKEKAYLLPIIGHISNHFKINTGFESKENGCHAYLAMLSLEAGIDLDEKMTAEQAEK